MYNFIHCSHNFFAMDNQCGQTCHLYDFRQQNSAHLVTLSIATVSLLIPPINLDFSEPDNSRHVERGFCDDAKRPRRGSLTQEILTRLRFASDGSEVEIAASSSEEESIYSEQGYVTVTVRDEDAEEEECESGRDQGNK